MPRRSTTCSHLKELLPLGRPYQLNCRDSVATIASSGNASANCIILRRFLSANPRPNSVTNCRDRIEGWSVRTLRERIDSMLYERTALSKQPDALIQQELALLRDRSEVTPALVLKDPYVLDFLELSDRFLERDLEEAILRELERFLLELGAGFSFVARQKRIQLDGGLSLS
jgi:predicted nuclease of restriction endonuclease-like (RecB) superfamily